MSRPKAWAKRDDGRTALIVACAASAAHALALAGGFIWLDHAHLEQGRALAQNLGLSAVWTGGFAGTGYYRPLMSLSLSIDAALGGSPFVYHLSSLLWHVLVSLAVSGVAQTLGQPLRAQRFAGVLFAVHPAASLTVSAIAFRSEALAAFCLLCLVHNHLRGRGVGAAFALFCGALCKETALVLGPLFAVTLSIWPAQDTPISRVRRLPLLGAEAAALALALSLRAAYAPALRATWPTMTWSEAVGTRLSALAKTFATLLVPLGSALDVRHVRASGLHTERHRRCDLTVRDSDLCLPRARALGAICLGALTQSAGRSRHALVVAPLRLHSTDHARLGRERARGPRIFHAAVSGSMERARAARLHRSAA